MTPTYSLTDAIARLDNAATLKDTGRHAYYQRTVDLADQYSALATGQKFEQFLVMFERREDLPQFNQRTTITVPKTPSLLAPAITQFQRTSRLPNIRRIVAYDKKVDDSRLTSVRETMGDFYGEGGVDEYIATVYDWVSMIDPNSYTVVEFDKDDQGIHPYPALYWSTMIYETGRSHRRQLQYLLVQPDPASVKEYILYAGAYAMRYTELPDVDKGRQDFINSASNIYTDDPIFQPKDANGKESGPPYLRQYYETKCPFVQAEVMGYLPDPTTNFQTFVSALEPAKYVLIDHLRTGSNFDLSKYLHVMPQKVALQPPCNADDCKKGDLPDGSKCKKCGGSGLMAMHSQPTDAVLYPMPRNIADIPDLANLIQYVQVELGTFTALDANLDKLANAVYVAIFNNELVQRQTAVGSTATATEISIKREDINNTLMPFAEHKALYYRFLVRSIAVLISDESFDNDKLSVVYEFPKDLKPITKDEIYASLKAAIESGAPPLQIEQIVKDLLEMDFEGDEEGLMKLRVRLSHIPFIGLDWPKIQYLDAQGYVRKRDMVLLAYQDSVFADLERTNDGFYDKLKYAERDKLITDYLNALVKELPAASPVKLNMGKVIPMPTDPQQVPATA